jgi:hypothetical protein
MTSRHVVLASVAFLTIAAARGDTSTANATAGCVRFSSELGAGQSFSLALPRSLELRLTPAGQFDWLITIGSPGEGQDFLSIASPPFGTKPLRVLAQDPSAAAAGEDRWLRFVPTQAEYDRALRIRQLKLKGEPAGYLMEVEAGTLRLRVSRLHESADAVQSAEIQGEACAPQGSLIESLKFPPATSASAGELIDRFKREQVFWRQFETGRQLAATGDRRTVRELQDWLTHHDRHIRGNVAFVLARLGDPRGFETIADILTDREPRLYGQGGSAYWTSGRQIAADRHYAAHLLGELGDRRAVSLLTPLLTDKEAQLAGVWALKKIGDRRAIGPLIAVLDQEDVSMRALAIAALESLNADAARPKLQELLHDHRTTTVLGRPMTVAEVAQRALSRLPPAPRQ